MLIVSCDVIATTQHVECRYTVQSLTSDIKSLKDNVKFVSDQLSVTHESFRHKLTSFVKVRTAQRDLNHSALHGAGFNVRPIYMSVCPSVRSFDS